jgi:hypothetical protein
MLGVAAGGSLRAQDAEQPSVWIEDDADRSELVIAMGPFDLAAGTRFLDELGPSTGHQHDPHAVHGAAVMPPVTTLKAPQSVYLTGFSYELHDADGQELPPDFVHHLNLVNPDNRELFLPIAQRMLAVGKETGSQSMPGLLMGYPVPEGTSIIVNGMLHNPSGASYEGVIVRVRLQYVPAGRLWPLFNVFPFQMDVAFPAGDKSFDLPPGVSTWSYEAQPSMEGRIMAISGHVHDLATSITFEDVTDGRMIWEGFPILDDDGALRGVTLGRLYRTLGAKVERDHVYRVTVTYDNPTADTLYAGGMGVVGGVFMQEGGGMWPRADKTDQLYALDMRHYLREITGGYDVLLGDAPPPAQHDHEAGH